MNKSLTKAEEQLMQVLWKIGRGYLKDIVDGMPEPKPHSNTVSTVIKILMEKGFIGHEVHGRVHCYFPIVTKEEFSGSTIRNFVDGYFEGSFSDVVSFMIRQEDMKLDEIEFLLKQIKDKKKKS